MTIPRSGSVDPLVQNQSSNDLILSVLPLANLFTTSRPSMSSPTNTQTSKNSDALSDPVREFEQYLNSQQRTPDVPSDSENTREDEVEQALETHEVIEIQAFIKHKEWIEGKIQYLERLPRVDIFAGADELDKTHNQISTLPTRAQLDDWLDEQERIERETELLDKGDLKKLKALTKAATQRNLSPEDTDLIEITLTTLFALDKLLHLLRDRSELLDLLGVRLTWEEQRFLAYKTRTELLDNLHDFWKERARWKPDVCDFDSSDEITSTYSNDPFGRKSQNTRIKLADELSREIVQFSSRISSLRHGPVATAGMALDKLIDDSRNPVPDTILDEQDRLEEKCDKELLTIGKFLMMVNMQWKKADEIYAESRGDTLALQRIIADVQNVLNQIPSRQTEVVLSSRFDTVKKRILARQNPSVLSASFPRPNHYLFPEHAPFNESLIRTLSAEVLASQELLNETNRHISSYRDECNMLEEVEGISKEIIILRSKFESLLTRLHPRDESDDNSGHRPDLTNPQCVDPIYSQAYLAVLPSVLEDLSSTELSASKLVKRARIRALRLNSRLFTEDYISAFRQAIDDLVGELDRSQRDRADVSLDIARLREVRHLWSLMEKLSSGLDLVTPTLKDAVVKSHWKQQFGGDAAPPTPESPSINLPTDPETPETVVETLNGLHEQFSKDVLSITDNIVDLPVPLLDHIVKKKEKLEHYFSDVYRLHKLWIDVRGQASAMESVRERAHFLENTIEESKNLYDVHYEQLLKDQGPVSVVTSSDTEQELTSKEQSLSDCVEKTKLEVDLFVQELPTRVPLISRRTSSESLSSVSSDKLPRSIAARLPINPMLVDKAVRNDTNAYTVRLNGGVNSLVSKRSFVGFYKTARHVSWNLAKAQQDAEYIDSQLEQHAQLLAEYMDAPSLSDSSPLPSLKLGLECIGQKELDQFRQSIQFIRGDLSQMRNMPGVQDDVTLLGVLNTRAHGLEELSLHSERIQTKLTVVMSDINRAEQAEAALAAKVAEEERIAFLEEEREKEELARAQKEREHAEKIAQQVDEQVNARLQELRAKRNTSREIIPEDEEDVFGPQTPVRISANKEFMALLTSIRSIRKRLKAIGINNVVRGLSSSASSGQHSSQLPTQEVYETMLSSFRLVERDAEILPESSENPAAEMELRSLRLEVDASQEMIPRFKQLANLSSSVKLCDSAFSEFLDYIDSYPNVPKGKDSSDGVSEVGMMMTPEDQLSERMSFTKGVFGDMSEHFSPVMDDERAISEHNRLKQTWEELLEMANEKLSGRTSRPGSVTAYSSSGRTSRASIGSVSDKDSKRGKYMGLSVNSKNGFLSPSSTKRRATSASSAGSSKQVQEPTPRPRSSLTVSRSSSRSVSGPIHPTSRPTSPPAAPSRSYFGSTFASRQRGSSVSSTVSSSNQSNNSVTRMRRRLSSLLSDVPPRPPSSAGSNRGTWARAPRQSFSSFPREATPEKPQKRTKKYIANPKNKLDVALGDVINNLPVDINVEAVAETWKDKSGKYWIGGGEPKLCFCRILRSQTVMVRVGGGWVELSKFIKDHFADLFRVMPETPPRPASREHWISAASLRNIDDGVPLNRSPKSPGSPESVGRGVPSFSISTPDGTHHSGSPRGSPLTPIQFMRRAGTEDIDVSLSSFADTNGLTTSTVLPLGLTTPSKSGAIRSRSPITPSKVAWRP